jgi:hypothetical protein
VVTLERWKPDKKAAILDGANGHCTGTGAGAGSLTVTSSRNVHGDDEAGW